VRIKSIFSNSGGILFSRIFGFLRDTIMASVLGANLYSDIFAVAFKLPNLFRRIFAEGAFTQSFMPSFIAAKYKTIFSVKIVLLLLGFILLLALFVNIFSYPISKILAPGFEASSLIVTSKYVALQFWYLPLIFLVTFLGALLQYKEHFATTAFATTLLNIALIIAMLLYKNASKEEILLAMSWGVIAGGILQVIAHLIVAKKFNLLKLFRYGFSNIKNKTIKVKEDTNRFFKNFFPAIWGNSTLQIMSFLDTWLASFLTVGSISYLYYGNRIFQLPLGLFAIAVSTAIFPSVTKKIKENNQISALLEFKKAFYILLYLLTAATVGGIIYSNEIIWLLFERGAFIRENTLNTASVLVMYMIGLIPYGLNKLFSLWLYANHKQKTAAKIATISLVTYLVVALSLIKPFGVEGLALAGSIIGFLNLFLTLKYFGVDNLLYILDKAKIFKFTIILTIFMLLLASIRIYWLHI
jgi:putative peptidoglycan lipid II flippase